MCVCVCFSCTRKLGAWAWERGTFPQCTKQQRLSVTESSAKRGKVREPCNPSERRTSQLPRQPGPRRAGCHGNQLPRKRLLKSMGASWKWWCFFFFTVEASLQRLLLSGIGHNGSGLETSWRYDPHPRCVTTHTLVFQSVLR